MSATGRLAGKVAFITGTAGGQGRAAAMLFAAEGARVIGCDLKKAEANETVELVRAAGDEMVSMAPLDLGDPETARAWIRQGVAEMGGIDILYNNAGGVRFGTIDEVTPDDWAFTVRNELDLVMWTVQAAWPHLVERGGGAIVNTASVAAIRGLATMGQAAHSAAKAGLIALTRQIAAEGARHNIRCNAILPGGVETPALEAAREQGLLDPVPMPLGRLAWPEDIAYGALYLASDEASYVTATSLLIDGGFSNIDGVEPQPI